MAPRLLPLLTLAASAACGALPQSAECAKWVSCYEAQPGIIAGSQDAAYGPGGTCWTGSPEHADQCTAECVAATRASAMVAGAPQACK